MDIYKLITRAMKLSAIMLCAIFIVSCGGGDDDKQQPTGLTWDQGNWDEKNWQ